MKPPLVLSSCDSFFSLHEHYLANPNGGSVRNLIFNNISKFLENPTVNETGIVILLRPFWVSAGKEKATVRRAFLLDLTWFYNSQRWKCSEMGCKRGAQISRWSNGEWVQDRHFSEIGLMSCGKKKGFWEEKGKNEKWGKEEALSIWKLT